MTYSGIKVHVPYGSFFVLRCLFPRSHDIDKWWIHLQWMDARIKDCQLYHVCPLMVFWMGCKTKKFGSGLIENGKSLEDMSYILDSFCPWMELFFFATTICPFHMAQHIGHLQFNIFWAIRSYYILLSAITLCICLLNHLFMILINNN